MPGEILDLKLGDQVRVHRAYETYHVDDIFEVLSPVIDGNSGLFQGKLLARSDNSDLQIGGVYHIKRHTDFVRLNTRKERAQQLRKDATDNIKEAKKLTKMADALEKYEDDAEETADYILLQIKDISDKTELKKKLREIVSGSIALSYL